MAIDEIWGLLMIDGHEGHEGVWVAGQVSFQSCLKGKITDHKARGASSSIKARLGKTGASQRSDGLVVSNNTCFIMFHHIVQAFLGWCFPFFCNISQLTSIFRQTTNQQSLRSFWVLPCPGEHQQDTGFRPGHLSSGSLWLSTASYTKSPNHISSLRNPCWLMIAGLYYPIYCGL